MKKMLKDFFYPSRRIFYTGYILLLTVTVIFLYCNKSRKHRDAVTHYENYLEAFGFSYDERTPDNDSINFLREDGSSVDLNMEYNGLQQYVKGGKYDLNYCDDTTFELIEGLTPEIGINAYRKQLEDCIFQKTYETNEERITWFASGRYSIGVARDFSGVGYSIVIFF